MTTNTCYVCVFVCTHMYIHTHTQCLLLYICMCFSTFEILSKRIKSISNRVNKWRQMLRPQMAGGDGCGRNVTYLQIPTYIHTCMCVHSCVCACARVCVCEWESSCMLTTVPAICFTARLAGPGPGPLPMLHLGLPLERCARVQNGNGNDGDGIGQPKSKRRTFKLKQKQSTAKWSVVCSWGQRSSSSSSSVV